MKCFPCAVLAFAAASSLRSQEPEADPVLAEARGKLAAIGYAPPDGMNAEARSQKQVLADLDAQQDALMPAGVFELQHALFQRLGLPAGRTAKVLRQQTIAAMARGLGAYYDPIRKVFVLLPSLTREVSEAMAGSSLPLVTHELVHAHQDLREGGLVALFGNPDRTLDSALARRCVIEGEAEVAALVALNGEDAVPQTDGMTVAGTLDRLFAGALTGAIYESGRQLAFRRHREGGFDAVRSLWQQVPASTEQILHPDKIGHDEPVAVAVPDVPGLTAAHATTIGELMLVDLLRQLGSSRLDASLGGAGWDGDRLVVFDRGDEAGVALVWRTAWDREEDAAQFAAALAGKDRLVVHDGRVVDWIAAADGELQAEIAQVCAAQRPQPAAVAGDAASTAAAEAALRAALPVGATDGGYWRPAGLGVAVPLSDEWVVKEVNGIEMMFLRATQDTSFAINVNVIAQPAGGVTDLEALIAANEAQFERMKLTVDKFEVTKLGDVDVAEGEYHGRIGQMVPMHFLALVWLHGDQQIWITVTASEEQWPERSAALRELMAGVQITPP